MKIITTNAMPMTLCERALSENKPGPARCSCPFFFSDSSATARTRDIFVSRTTFCRSSFSVCTDATEEADSGSLGAFPLCDGVCAEVSSGRGAAVFSGSFSAVGGTGAGGGGLDFSPLIRSVILSGSLILLMMLAISSRSFFGGCTGSDCAVGSMLATGAGPPALELFGAGGGGTSATGFGGGGGGTDWAIGRGGTGGTLN